MITVGMNYHVVEGREQDFEEKFAAVIGALNAAEGHTTSTLWKDVDDGASYLITSEWSDEEAFGEAFGRPVERYWSSSAYDDSSSYAWYVLFHYGRVSYDAKNIDHLVRLVRGGD